MKKIFTYFGLVLAVALTGVFSACNPKETVDADAESLGIKSVLPTKVVAGAPMLVSGTGFGDVREVVFPDGISVTNIEHVGNGSIRLVAPSGISPNGGKLIVRTSDDEAEYKIPITLGNTNVTGYSKQDGEEIEGGQQLTVFGSDLEFICRAELLDPDGNPMILEDGLFYRKGTNSVVITIPRKIFEGTWTGKLYTYDGKEFLLPELTYKQPTDGGHWEIVKNVIWENTTGDGPCDWGNLNYRFGLDGHDGNNECDATFPQEIWDKIKSETFYATLSGDNPQIRITDGWWSVNLYAEDIQNPNDLLIDNGDGTWTLEINLTSSPDLLAVLDAQHLLLTGGGFTLTDLYFLDEIWIDGGEETGPEPEIIWENTTGDGPCDWGNLNYRFGLDGHDGNNECDATFPQEIWDRIKSETFYATLSGDNPQIRITDGWWSANLYPADIQNPNDLLIDNGDGTWTLVVNLTTSQALLDVLDSQHLLFTGQGFTLLNLFFQEGGPTPGGGGGDTPDPGPGPDVPVDVEGTVIFDTETVFADWGATIVVDAAKFADVQEGDIIRVYIKDKTGEFNPVFKHAEDWSDWGVFQREDGDNYFQAAVPAEAVEELKAKGLRFQGIGFTLVAVTIIASTPAIVPEGTILFDTETAFDSWSATCVVPPEKFADVKAGDIIRVYFKNKGSDYNPIFKHVNDWSDWTELARVDGDNYFEASVPAEALEELKSTGLRFQGVGFTLVAVTHIPYSVTLWEGESVFDSWSATLVVEADKFASIEAGNVIRVTIKDKGSDYNPIFKHVADWSDWTELARVDGNNYFEATVPAEAIEELKSAGLRFQGVGFTITKVSQL